MVFACFPVGLLIGKSKEPVGTYSQNLSQNNNILKPRLLGSLLILPNHLSRNPKSDGQVLLGEPPLGTSQLKPLAKSRRHLLDTPNQKSHTKVTNLRLEPPVGGGLA